MGTRSLRRALGIALIVAFLVGCGGSGPSSVPLRAASVLVDSSANKHDYESLHNFRGAINKDGAQPVAGLVPLHGILYGTTLQGGTWQSFDNGLGTVFSITGAGREAVLWDFNLGTDETEGVYSPSSDLTLENGTLYGVAEGVTPYTYGGIYAVTLSNTLRTGAVRVIYEFKGPPDGSTPVSSLMADGGKLYGETVTGGTGAGRCRNTLEVWGCGTVFKLSTSGAERVLHSFKRDRDGIYPVGNLIAVKGTLYGTTLGGGKRSVCSFPAPGCGTVFSINTVGKQYRVLYRFEGSPYDGEPTLGNSNGLVVLNDVLYGTTAQGGTSGLGTVYAITLSGSEKILHNFSGVDGANPSARLTVVNGVLYGTTAAGGTSNNCSGGCGTVFKISTSGAEEVLHSFQGKPDGSNPVSDLTFLNGKLYGTTQFGGTLGEGTVFRISP